MSKYISILLLSSFCVVSSTAQESHVSFISGLVKECLDAAVDGRSSFKIRAQGQATYSLAEVVKSWREAGKSIFLEDANIDDQDLLVFTVDAAELSYDRQGKNQLGRTAKISLTHWLSDSEGRVIGNDTCAKTASDTLSRKTAKAMGDNRYPETDPSMPHASRWRQVAEPLVLIGASAVGTYLFFNLRSRRANSG